MHKLLIAYQALLDIFVKYWYVALGGVIILFCLLFGPITFTFISTRGYRYDLMKTNVNQIPAHHVAIVFGAGVTPSGQPTPYLQSRIATAVDLYKAHRVDKLLMSGDNSTKRYDEPVAMRDYAIKLGVKSGDIRLDYAGYSTYDTCYRAHTIFGLNSATLVSQGYHLPRAMATCRGLGVSNIGVVALHHQRDFTISYILRELISTDKMIFQLIVKPKPTLLGKPEPVI